MTSSRQVQEELQAELVRNFAKYWKDFTGVLPTNTMERNEVLLANFDPEKHLPTGLKEAWSKTPGWKKKGIPKEAESELQKQRAEEAASNLQLELNATVWVEAVELHDDETHVFRNAGRGQEPWDIIDKGFEHRKGIPDNPRVVTWLKNLFTCPDGAVAKVNKYREENNWGNLQEPIPWAISAGPGIDDKAGKDVIWRYAFEVPTLTRVPNDVIQDELGLTRIRE